MNSRVEINCFTRWYRARFVVAALVATLFVALMSSFALPAHADEPAADQPASGMVTSTITVTEDATWDGITLTRDPSFTSGPMVVVSGDANLSLTNVVLDGNSVPVVASLNNGIGGAALSVTGNATVTLGEGTLITQNMWGASEASAVSVGGSGSTANLTIDGAVISDNNVKGAGAIIQNASGSTVTFNSGVMENNQAMYAGAILVFNGNFIMNGGTVQGNQAVTGGGMRVGASSFLGSSHNGHVVLNGGVFQNNQAVNGGGIAFDRGTAEINAVQVLNNIAIDPDGLWAMGGGMYFNEDFNNREPLVLRDVLIADNDSSYRGGGLWLCAAGEANVSYVTNGVAFVDNQVADTYQNGGGTSVMLDEQPSRERSLVFAPRALGGGARTIYNDLAPRYEAGDEALPLDHFAVVPANTNAGVLTEISYQGAEQAEAVAKIIVKGNSARSFGLGGGIANNASLIFGDAGEKSLSVEKVWDDNGPTERPLEIEVELVSEDDFVVDSATLSQSNDWKYTFAGLPTNLDYSVREKVVPDGYAVAYDRVVDDATGDISYTITNTLDQADLGTFTLRKAVAGLPVDHTFPEGTTFAVGAAWTLDGEEFSQVFDLPADGTVVDGPQLPLGTEVTFSEQDPPEIPGFEWTGASFDPAQVVIGSGDAVAVTVTNSYRTAPPETLGTFSLSKSLSGVGVADFPRGTTFAVTATWSLDGEEMSQVFDLPADGTVVEGPALPIGTEVTFSEPSAPSVSGYAWDGVQFSQQSIVISGDSDASVIAVNTYSEQKLAVTGAAGLGLGVLLGAGMLVAGIALRRRHR